MPELRIDPLSGLRVIVAGERGTRPGAWLDVPQRPPIDPGSDPFAEGHEDQTPPEVYALREGSERDSPAGACAWCRTSTRRSPPASRTRAPTRWPEDAASRSCSPRARRAARTS